MAPPNRLRPHLNDLLQKNHELEHTVADLRHQHTQSAAKWADEQKNLAMGCDALMASFAKFRARLDTQPSDWVDSEGEQDHDMGAGGAGNGETQRDKESENLHEMCRTLAAELKTRDEQIVESQRKFEATEEELRRVIETSRAQIEQLQATLAFTRANIASDSSPGLAPNDTSGQADLASSGPESAREKTTSSDQEISRLKQLLQQWQKYGNDWKRDAQAARSRVSALELVEKELNARLAVAEKDSVLLEKERKEAQKVAIALTEQQVATEYQKSARQEAVKRANDLEASIARLRAQISPEQLATFDATPNQATAQPDSTQRQTPRANADTDTRNEMIVLRIPLRPARKSFGENNGSSQNQENRTSASAPVDSASHANDVPATSDYEVCIHTCNPFRCRNESRSFLWLRKRSGLLRHALSVKKHHSCNPDCPGHRLLNMSQGEAVNEPRRAKCRPPSDAELALAAEEARNPHPDEQEGENEGEHEGEHEGEGDEGEPREGSRRDEEEAHDDMDEDHASSKWTGEVVLGKRLRPRHPEIEESFVRGDRKLRPRVSKP